MAFGDDVESRGWKTGSVISAVAVPALVPHLTQAGQQPTQIAEVDWLVVVSQTCDVVAPKLEAEPLVEILHCRPHAGKPRKGRRNLESTRYLDFLPNRGLNEKLVLAAHAIADRYTIPREFLAANDPDADRALDLDASRKLLAWYALRAARPSWPNNFCDRVRTVREDLEKALDRLSDEIAEVRLSIEEKDQDLGPEQPYHIAVYFVVDEDIWNRNIDDRVAINNAFAEFVAALNACEGIAVNQGLSEVVPGHEFTWQDTKQTDLWDFANLSHRD